MVIDLNALIITLNVGYPYTQIIIERLEEWLKTDRMNVGVSGSCCNSSSSCRAPGSKYKALSSKSQYRSHLHRKMEELCVVCGKSLYI
jgi:hypothetical protein